MDLEQRRLMFLRHDVLRELVDRPLRLRVDGGATCDFVGLPLSATDRAVPPGDRPCVRGDEVALLVDKRQLRILACNIPPGLAPLL